MSKDKRCQHRDVAARHSYYDAQGKARVRHEYAYCGSRADLAVDCYGYAYCANHRADGDFGQAVDVDLDAVLRGLINRSR